MNLRLTQSTSVEIEASALDGLVLEAEFAIVYALRINEIAPKPDQELGLINLTGWAHNPRGGQVGLCLMLVGTDADNNLLWACCLKCAFVGTDAHELMESMLVSPKILGKTKRVTMRVYGRRWEDDQEVP